MAHPIPPQGYLAGIEQIAGEGTGVYLTVKNAAVASKWMIAHNSLSPHGMEVARSTNKLAMSGLRCLALGGFIMSFVELERSAQTLFINFYNSIRQNGGNTDILDPAYKTAKNSVKFAKNVGYMSDLLFTIKATTKQPFFALIGFCTLAIAAENIGKHTYHLMFGNYTDREKTQAHIELARDIMDVAFVILQMNGFTSFVILGNTMKTVDVEMINVTLLTMAAVYKSAGRIPCPTCATGVDRLPDNPRPLPALAVALA